MDVLVVDDDRTCRLLYRRELERGGYTVIEATHGLEALAILQNQAVDLITLDLSMPKMGGFELCDRLLSRDFACHFHQNREHHLPILVITANASVNKRVMGLRRGIADYLIKGFEPGALLKRVNQILKPTNPFTGLRALLISETRETIQKLGLRLGELGLEADPIAMTSEGFAQIQSLPAIVDVVFIDTIHCQFGPELCEKVRHQLAREELPIIVLVAQNAHEDLIPWFAAGATDFLVSPFSKSELKAKLGTAMTILRSEEHIFPRDFEVFPPSTRNKARKDLLPEQSEGEKNSNTIIHNIGNILNSVVVSSNLLRQKAEESQIWKLIMAHDLLRENSHQLHEYLTTDPKGRKLIPYLLKVGERLEHEYTQVIQRLSDLETKVQLMQSMLTVQQSNKPRPAQWEPCDVVDIIKPALNILKEALQSTRVDVQQTIEPGFLIQVPRNKMIHVFINMIKNAIEAMRESPERQLLLACRSENETVSITISDTGVGLRKDQVDKLFQRGFTTKLNGHGFGLAFCQAAVREVQGWIEVKSAGHGQGTSFTLHLPQPSLPDAPSS